MSRTYRRAKLPIDCNCGAKVGFTWGYRYPTPQETEKEINESRRKGVAPTHCCRCRHSNRKYDYYSKRNHKRDNKPKENSDRTYKKIYNRSRRAKVSSAMSHGKYDCLPLFKRSNDLMRNWNYW